ncbi:hypothetical protein P5705_03255 [Pseudomonas entomophila]|uniref:hypothetical protein n=1 Tax=Pseudomonas entomophila TaxID=312306 RepID=UPI002404C0CB|nr:hypothetical protein [Pseudomonas entomophila]MDF9616653.1 hypothetical protein [Pseudomonas entomophila]
MIRSNFTAELHCQHGQVVVVDTAFADHLFTSADEDGWLSTERAKPTGFKRVDFSFQFIKHEGDRTHYFITCAQSWDYAGARLEQNKNGWLGLYGTHVIGRIIDAINPSNLLRPTDFWKIETLQPWDGDVQSAQNIEFYLRDKYGHRVSQALPSSETITLSHDTFLNAGKHKGEILKFKLRNIQLA